MMSEPIQFVVNRKPVSVDSNSDRSLLSVLRNDLELTGSKYGCGEGICGACAVLIDGKPARACKTSMAAVDGKQVITIEGLAQDGALHPLQHAFIKHGAVQCGFCTSGMLLAAYVLLADHPHPSREHIVTALDHYLCRCGAHQRIIQAIQSVAGCATEAM